MKKETVCQINKCVACNACVNICPVGAIVIDDSIKNCNAVINSDKCIRCGACKVVCQKHKLEGFVYPQKWKQGWTNDTDRETSSSGGAVVSIAKAFIKNGGIACLCRFYEGKFNFGLVENCDELVNYVGSKYVKSDMEYIYGEINEKLKNGRKVLFVGLPCQVAGIKKFINEKNKKNLYTMDLICHGTPSVKLLENYLNEQGYSLNQVKKIYFRKKNLYHLYIQYADDKEIKKITHKGERDRYTMAFFKGLDYTENCYECDFARIERISDLTVGDSWGSTLDVQEQSKGISLLLCQTKKGEELIDLSDMNLLDVDLDKAKAANQQLNYSVIKPNSRDKFFYMLDKNMKFSKAVGRCLPKLCIIQKVKKWLIRLGIWKLIDLIRRSRK